MLAGLGAISGSLQAGQGSSFGNAGPSANGDTILGPISQGGPVVTFAGASNNSAPAGGGLAGINPLVLAGAAGLAVWFLSKRR
ncbi:MAG: hypothetical protein CMP77_02020 [Flavobacterium sp.]|nr:hypothetical protein [Flavobacterium sp.]MBE98736.1 hypothetical protein [Flavobacterium sp.]|tara:strand:+ start:2164 stop:2412 length:249 start_codon:yes stop_codon:yes gene_type:complete